MIQFPSFEFTYGKYGSSIIPWKVIKSTEAYIKFLLSKNIIGYCKSIECKIRPRKDDMAVMFEIDDWQSWVHIPIDIWQKFLENENGNENSSE